MRLKFWKKQEKQEKKDIVQYQGGAYIFGSGGVSAPKISNYLHASTLNEVVYGCISLITLAALDVDWLLYRQQGKDAVEVTSHPVLNFLARPSKTASWSRFMEEYLHYLLLAGNCYLRKYIGSFGAYGEVEPLRPDKVTPIGKGKFIQRYDYYTPEGRVEPIKPEEIIHVKLFNPKDELVGLSPITTIATQIDIASYSQAWMLALLEKGAMPAVVFSMPADKSLTQPQRDFLKEQIKDKVLGYENVMNPLILEGGMKPEKVAFSPKEIDFMPLTKTVLRKICNVFHVPSELLGDSENKTYSNVKEANKALYELATFPRLNLLKDELNHGLLPLFKNTENMFIDFDTSNIEALADDKDALWTRVNRAVDTGVITRNEAREIIKYGKAKEKSADKLTVTGLVQPLDSVTGDSTEEL